VAETIGDGVGTGCAAIRAVSGKLEADAIGAVLGMAGEVGIAGAVGVAGAVGIAGDVAIGDIVGAGCALAPIAVAPAAPIATRIMPTNHLFMWIPPLVIRLLTQYPRCTRTSRSGPS
jgi:hypothetical protein